MKKITLLSFALLAGLISFSQQRGTGNARTMSFEEANRLNGVANPTINGKPYSQYKAEQEALKNKQPKTEAAMPATLKVVTSDDIKKASATQDQVVTTAPEVKPVEVTAVATPVLTLPLSAPGTQAQPVAAEVAKPTRPQTTEPAKQAEKPKGN